MQNFNLKKFFLYLLIASVAVSALIGIGVILFGDFGEFETKILLTAITITCTSILGLACGAFLETKRGKILPVCGIGLAILSAVLWIYLIWNGALLEEFLVKTLMSTTLLAIACSHLSLLSLARLDKKFLWSLYAAHAAVWSLTAILLWLIWTNARDYSEFVTRAIGVLSIVVASLTIITPIFHKLSNALPEENRIDDEIAELKNRLAELEKRKAEIREQVYENNDRI